MKIAFVILSIVMTVGCIKDPQFTPAEIGISTNVLDMPKEAGSVTIKLLSNREWEAELTSSDGTPEWISLSQMSGTPSSDSVSIVVSLLPNGGEDRYATINFRTETVYASLRVSQIGEIQKQYTPISAVRELYQGSNVVIDQDFVIRGTVISNYRSTDDGGLNNATSRKTMIVQDETAGISLYLTENNTTFAVGDVLEIKLKGFELQRYNNGSLQVDALPLANISYLTNNPVVEPIEITAAQLVSGDYESRYIAVADVQVADSDMGKTFVKDESHTSINFVAKTGEKFVLFSSGYSSYGAETVPTGSGTLKGIAMVYGSTKQISITATSDYAGLTGERFEPSQGGTQPGSGALIGDYNTWNSNGPVSSFMDEFISVSAGNAKYENPSWLFYTTDGDGGVNTGWKTGTYNEDKYIQIAPYSSSADQVVAFALIPRADVASASPKEYSFKKALYYLETSDNTKLEVVVSKDFTGDFGAATWEVVKDATFPADAQKNTWVEEKVDLSAYSSETDLCIALRYTGKGNTYRIDDVKFGDGQQAPFFNVTPATKAVTSAPGSFNISIVSNVEWSISSDNSAFVPSVTSGSGTASVSIGYTENNSDQERVANITISTADPSVAQNSFTCVVTQKAPGASAGGEFTSNVDITSNTDGSTNKSYAVKVITDGVEYDALKLGTSSVAGTYTVTSLPATGDVTLGLYAVAWKGRTCDLTITLNGGGTINGSSSVTVSLAPNEGLHDESPFTVEFAETDYYTFELSGVTTSTTMTFSTTTAGPRCLITGVNLF